MGKKKNKNNNNNTNAENEVQHKEEPMTKDGGGDGGENEPKKENKNGPSVVVLKVEMDCEGCASRIVRLVRSFEGVESVKAEIDSNKLTVMGKVNPSKIRENLHHKTKKKVDLVSPQPKKDDSNDNKTPQNDKKSGDNKKQQPHSDNTAKKAQATTAVLKMNFHCQGCVDKIHKTVSKSKGVDEMSFDRQKETVTVKGTMDVKALAEALKERLKRPVEVVPPKKEKEGGDKDGEGGGGSGNGGGKNKNGGGGKGSGDGEGGGNKMEMLVQPGFGSAYGFEPVYGYAPVYGNGFVGHPHPPPHHQFQVVYPEYGYGYGYGYVPGYPVHMKFNDENPNACSVM